MLDIKPQPSLAAAITEMLWACAFAAARVADAFAARGAAFWSQLLSPPVEPAARAIAPRSGISPSPADAARPAAHLSPPPPAPAEPPETPETPPSEAAFATYRSAGGHASAQVIVPASEPPEAGQTISDAADAGLARQPTSDAAKAAPAGPATSS